MNLASVIPPTPADVADYSDTAACQEKMVSAIQRLAALANDVGAARTIQEFSSDRRKRALARACAAALAGGESAAKAELEARADESYGRELAQLQKEHQAAEQVLTEWEVTKLSWSTAQSLLAMMRESVKRL